MGFPGERTSERIRVLLVEEDDDDAARISDLLARLGSERFMVDRVAGFGEACGAAFGTGPDLVLLGLAPADPCGTGTIVAMRDLVPGRPLVVLAGSHDALDDQAAATAGAHGYVAKDEVTLRSLDRELRQASERCRLLGEIASMRREARELSIRDPLTGLANRLHLIESLGQALSGARRTETGVGVLVLDLDNFKQVNEVFGHRHGDELLACIARRLKSAVRESDTVARLGGDEFVVVVTNLHCETDCARVACKLLEAVSERIVLGGREHRMKASAGIAVAPGGRARASDLLREADTAVFHAKRSRPGQFAFYSVAMTIEAVERMEIEARLRGAADRGELYLEYQPVIDLSDDRIVGLEALVRWRVSPGEVMPPAKFIPIAERMGEIVPLGAWVLRQACRDVAELRRTIDPALAVAANVSGRQLQDRWFADVLRSAAAEAGVPPSALLIEITESTIVDGSEQTTASIRAVREAGFRIGIDDFGTGYSSLVELKQFPVSEIKIDRCFVSGLPASRQDLMIVSTIVSLARGLGAGTVAEGVETAEQLEVVRELGCSHAQGYHVSRPVPIEAVPALFERWKPQPPRARLG